MRNALTTTNAGSRNLIKVLFGLMLCTLLLVGCSSSDSNPMNPDDNNTTDPPVVEIKKPVKVTINSIKVTRTQDKDWDPSELIREWKKADLFVKMGLSGGNVDYESNVVNDVNPGGSYTFTNRRGLTGNKLPLTYLYVDRIRIELWDNDVVGDDDMGHITFNASSLYNNDEATTFSKTLYGNKDSRIVVKGTFRY